MLKEFPSKKPPIESNLGSLTLQATHRVELWAVMLYYFNIKKKKIASLLNFFSCLCNVNPCSFISNCNWKPTVQIRKILLWLWFEDNNKTWFLAFVQPVLKNRLYDFALIYREHVVGFLVLAKTKSYNLKFSLSFFQLFYCRL